jgi:hypothetical protein
MKKIIYISIAFLASVLTFYSCNNPLALGTRLNIEPPVVTITSPGFMDEIGAELNITGTASDLEEIVFLNVTIERASAGESWKQQWQGERGRWRSRSTEDSVWENKTGEGINWTLLTERGNIDWSIRVSMADAPCGEYLITVGVVNNVNNEGANAQLRIIISNSPPVTTIHLPVLQEGAYADVIPVFDGFRLRDPGILDRLFNQDIEIQYEIDEEYTINTLVIQLMDKDGNVFYNEDKTPVANVSRSGRTTIPGDEINMSASGVLLEKVYLQLITIATNMAGNEKPRGHGWLVYWPASDKPWVSAFEPDGVNWNWNDPNNDPKDNEVFPLSEIQFLVYDDDGVDEITYQVFRWNHITQTILETFDPVTRKNEPIVTGGIPSRFFSYGFIVPTVSAEYKIRIDCKDINGTAGETIVRYFYVTDISIPDIIVDTPDRTLPLFGNASGDFTISGKAGDGVAPVNAKLVWIKPGNTDDLVRFQSAFDSGWESTGTDLLGNIVWDIPLGAQDIVNGRVYRPFSRTLNLFTDLGIDGDNIKLTTQNFILRVEGSTSGNAVTKLHAVKGDITPPELSIDNIIVNRGSVETVYSTATLEVISNLSPGDTVSLNGTWNDDSFAVWNNTSRMVGFTATWNGIDIPGAVLNNDNTWTAGPFPLDIEQIERGGGRIEVNLYDLGGNRTVRSFSARIDTVMPVLVYISSTGDSGSYGVGEQIDIYIQFNKLVKFTGTTVPTLSLNNGKSAVYMSGLHNNNYGEYRHVFRYTVAAGDDVTSLNVTAIISDNTDWEDVNGNNPVLTLPALNLADTKPIQIDTVAPTIIRVEARNDDGHYRAGQNIFILVTFSEEIIFTPAPNNPTTLVLNVGTGMGRDPILMGNNSLLFRYLIIDGDNTPLSEYLTAVNISLNGGRITDLARNELITDIPTNQNITNNTTVPRSIVIDTDVPAPPTLNADAGIFYTPQTFTISGEPGATLEYQVNNGSWQTYTGTVTLSSVFVYEIRARQIDRARNVSLPTAPVTIEIRTADRLLQSLGGSLPGTYKTGEDVFIRLYLSDRGLVTVTGGTPTLTLNSGTGATAQYDGVTGNAIVFRYTVQQGHNVETLLITDLILGTAVVSAGGVNLNAELMDNFDTISPLSFYTRIRIDTSIPIMDGMSLIGTTLSIGFDKDIFKGVGSITIEQAAGTYLAPAVLTRADFLRFGGAGVLGNFYTVGTSGTSNTGVPDLSEKYILRYELDTDDAAVVAALMAEGAHRVVIPVVSGAVTISSNRRTMNVNLGPAWGYMLRVRGVDYTISFPRTLVQDNLGNNLATDVSDAIISNPGVNAPFIRVQRQRERIENTASNVPTLSTQTYYNWVPPPPADAPVSLGEPANPTGWQSMGAFSIGPTFTAYVQDNSPGHSYFRLQDFVHGTASGTGQFQTNVGVWHNSNTNQLHAGWGNPGGSGWVSIATGNSYPDGAIVGIQGYSPNIWVSLNDNTFVSGMDWGRGGIVIYDLWINIPDMTPIESINSPGAGYINIGISRIDVIQNTFNPTTLIAVQPLTAQVKIDSQTPDVTIRYSYNLNETTPFQGPFNMGNHTRPSVNMPSVSATLYSGSFSLGENNLDGNLYAIRAQVFVDNVAVPDAVAYDVAARSVIMFDNITQAQFWSTGSNNLSGQVGTGNQLQLWIRGGDDLSGDSLTPGFPLEWSEHNLSGIRLLTRPSSATGIWYWVSWDINTAAYFHFIAGVTPNTASGGTGLGSLNDIRNNGPTRWSWAKNAWAFQHREYPLYPGGSLLFNRNTVVSDPATENFEFHNVFSGSR